MLALALAFMLVLAVRGVGVRICAAVIGGDGCRWCVAMVIGGVNGKVVAVTAMEMEDDIGVDIGH